MEKELIEKGMIIKRNIRYRYIKRDVLVPIQDKEGNLQGYETATVEKICFRRV